MRGTGGRGEGVRVCGSCCSVYTVGNVRKWKLRGISKFICESFLCEFCGLRCDAQNFRVNVPIHKDLPTNVSGHNHNSDTTNNVLSTRILIQCILHTHPNVLMHFPLKFLWSHICQWWCVCVNAWTYYMYCIYISVHCTHTHTHPRTHTHTPWEGHRALTNELNAGSFGMAWLPTTWLCLSRVRFQPNHIIQWTPHITLNIVRGASYSMWYVIS